MFCNICDNYYFTLTLYIYIMKRFVFILLALGCLSCATHKWVDVTSDVNIEELMREKFPRLYPSYLSNDIEVTKVEQRSENGELIYRVTHKDVYSDSSDDDLLWQTIFLPMLIGN